MKYFATCVLLSLYFTDNGLNGFSYKDLPKNCGQPKYKEINLRTCEATTALVGEVPWIVRVGIYQNGKKFFYCSGSLIHPSYVITAAHCGTLGNMVRVGENNLEKEKDCSSDDCAPPYQDIIIENHLFSNHCRKSNVNDMSLLALKTPAELNDYVHPICLPPKKLSLKKLKERPSFSAGWGVTYSGWGMVDGSKLRTERGLQFTLTPILDRKQCNKKYVRNLEENELCVGYPEGVEMPCVADSGGPLMQARTTEKDELRTYIIGLASHNLELCREGDLTPRIYTDLASHVDWIVEKIDDDMQSKTESRK